MVFFLFCSRAKKQSEISAQGRAVVSSLRMFEISLIFGIIKLLETSEDFLPLDNMGVALCLGGTMLGKRLHEWWSSKGPGLL